MRADDCPCGSPTSPVHFPTAGVLPGHRFDDLILSLAEELAAALAGVESASPRQVPDAVARAMGPVAFAESFIASQLALHTFPVRECPACGRLLVPVADGTAMYEPARSGPRILAGG